jgi:hypothetical protein
MIIYQSDDGVKLDVRLENKTVWLNQDQIASLFNKSKSTIVEHISNIFKEGELDEKVVVRKFRITTQHGAMAGKTQSKEVKFYNLDVIISVGYRVKSIQGTRFRQWATERLNEYIVKGFTMDDERLKNLGGGNYWKESCKISCTMLLMGIQRQKLSMENSFSKTAIKISFSFHNYHSVRIIIHLSVKGEFCIPIFLRQSGETTKEPTALTTAPFTLS